MDDQPGVRILRFGWICQLFHVFVGQIYRRKI